MMIWFGLIALNRYVGGDPELPSRVDTAVVGDSALKFIDGTRIDLTPFNTSVQANEWMTPVVWCLRDDTFIDQMIAAHPERLPRSQGGAGTDRQALHVPSDVLFSRRAAVTMLHEQLITSGALSSARAEGGVSPLKRPHATVARPPRKQLLAVTSWTTSIIIIALNS
eukprot:CAMPEP_0119430050 /NCGR_PEP_ID=MMETSP1335-20130426/43350_1 /TAXON_ID=259385 /ORGANISM="Chrysoculter rhomboideus, Strain RCC1486" /LENGTH=166 /DNA_ID=CAMNT_0007455795 /DNA_START=205 /DNA_END=702 /DNA_ORIENTATION=+